mmetsp:Transcript_31388/g.53000  ORF Transcript_31388/g.53000 Transcript_31388/m.53000 type:complete len:215 (-) Transcript_31388:328-972(-)
MVGLVVASNTIQILTWARRTVIHNLLGDPIVDLSPCIVVKGAMWIGTTGEHTAVAHLITTSIPGQARRTLGFSIQKSSTMHLHTVKMPSRQWLGIAATTRMALGRPAHWHMVRELMLQGFRTAVVLPWEVLQDISSMAQVMLQKTAHRQGPTLSLRRMRARQEVARLQCTSLTRTLSRVTRGPLNTRDRVPTRCPQVLPMGKAAYRRPHTCLKE